MPKAPPQFNFFYNDWLGGTMHLSLEEQAAYLRLLIYQWQHGFIPLTERNRMGCCNVIDIGKWQHIWQNIRDKFEPFELDETTVAMRNTRMHEDRDHAISVWEKRRYAAAKGGKSRAKEAKAKRVSIRASKRVSVSDKDMDMDTVKKKKKEESVFTVIPPTREAVVDRIKERGLGVDADAFLAYYEARGWMLGKSRMKNWDCCLTTWERNGYGKETLKLVAREDF